MYGAKRGNQTPWNELQMVVSHHMVLEIEPRSSRRAVSVFKL